MNLNYRIIWNSSLNTYQVASELTKSKGKSSSSSVVSSVQPKTVASFAYSLLAASLLAILTPNQAQADTGIFINDHQDKDCSVIFDHNRDVGIFGINPTTEEVHSNAKDPSTVNIPNYRYGTVAAGNNPCNVTETGVQSFAEQTNRTVFYGMPNGSTDKTTNNGAMNLSLGGRLDVNSGIIGLGNRGANGTNATNSIRMGTGTSLDDTNNKTNAITIGVDSGASADYSIAVGAGAEASNATGTSSVENLRGATAIGTNAKATAAQSIAIGGTSQATTNQAVAIGYEAFATGSQAIALGGNTRASGNSSIAIGGDDLNAVANKAYAAGTAPAGAIGSVSNDVYNDSDAAKIFHDMTGEYLVNMERATQTTNPRYVKTEAGAGAVALGVSATAGDLALGIGTKSKAAGVNSTAIGTAANSSYNNSVAIGAGSKTDSAATKETTATVNGITYSGFAGADDVSEGDQVSVGSKGYERQIKNVAAGKISSSSTDAINGSQLYAVMDQLANAGSDIHYYSVNDGGTQRNNYNNDGATGINALAAGVNAVASGDQSVAVGNGAVANKGYASSFGISSTASGVSSLAVGLRSKAEGGDSVAVGPNAQATNYSSIALGNAANAAGNAALALGRDSQAAGMRDIAIGAYAMNGATSAAQQRNIAIGDSALKDSKSDGNNIAIGTSSGQGIDGLQNVMLGAYANSDVAGVGSERVNNTVAIGTRTLATKQEAISVGYFTKATGESSVAVGSQAEANAKSANAIGRTAVASGENSNAIGTGASATHQSALAIGSRAGAKNENAIAVGGQAEATGRTSVALGTASKAQAESATALGAEAEATKDNALAAGVNAKAQENSAVALGNKAEANGSAAVALGRDSVASATNALAFGHKAQATQANGVALGSNSVANVAAGKVGSDPLSAATAKNNPTWTATSAAVSVGDITNNITRQITSVAAGTEDTDAVNVAQLKAAGFKLVATKSDGEATSIADDKVLNGETLTVDAGKNIKVTHTDNEISIATKDEVEFDSVTVPNKADPTAPSVVIKNGAISGLTTTIADPATATNVTKPNVTTTNAATLGDVLNTGWNIQGNGKAVDFVQPYDTVNFVDGNGTVAKVETTDNKTTTVKYDVNVDNNTIKVGNDGKLYADVKDTDTVTSVINGDTTTVTKGGTAEAPTYKVEVNKAGIDTTPTDTPDADKITINEAGKVVAPTDSKKAGNTFITAENLADVINNTGFTLKTSATDGEKLSGSDEVINPGDTVEMVAGKNLTVKQEANGKITYATKDEVEFTSVKAGPVTINNNGINAGDKKVTNVAEGDLNPNSKDAVNGSQLYATNQNVDKNTKDIAKGLNFMGDTGTVSNRKLGETVTVKGGVTDVAKLSDNNIGVVSDGKGNLDVKLAKDITVDSVKAGPVTINNNGINAGNKPITNVAAGTNPTDAVNVSQLEAAQAAATTKVVGKDGVKVEETTNPDKSKTYTVSAKTDGTTIKTDGNGNLTANTAPINSTDGKATTGDKNALATAGDVINAVNNSGFTLKTSATEGEKLSGSDEFISSGNAVEMVAGKNLTVKQEANGKVTYATKDEVEFNSVTVPTDPTDPNAPKIVINNNGIDAGDKKITNVADGTEDGDAVNYKQLKDMQAGNQAATTWKVNTEASPEAKSVSNQTVTVNHGINTKVSEVKQDAAGNYSYEIDVTGLPMEYVDKDGNPLVNVGGKFYTQQDNGAGGLTLTPAEPAKVRISSDKPMQLSNVAAGDVSANSTDAVNGAQLHATNQNVANNAANIAKLDSAVDKGLDFAGDVGGFNRKLGQKTTVKGGITDESKLSNNNIGVIAKGDTLEVKLAKDIKVDSLVAGNTTINNGGVTIAAANPENNVSLTSSGLNNGGNRIINVAPGVNDTDAVNVAQLKGITNNINNLHNHTHKVDRNARAGIAGALATGDLPQPYLPSKSMIAVGVGSYRGETAIALGASKNSDNGKWIIKGSANMDSRRHVGVSGSIGYQF